MYDPSALVDVSKSLTGTAETLKEATAAINRVSGAVGAMIQTLRQFNAALERERDNRRKQVA